MLVLVLVLALACIEMVLALVLVLAGGGAGYMLVWLAGHPRKDAEQQDRRREVFYPSL